MTTTRTLHLLDVEYLGCGPVFSAGDLELVLDRYRPRVDWHRGDIAIGTASTWVYRRIAFAYYGGSLKVDGDWVQHPQSIVVMPDADERAALIDDPRVYVPAYLGPSGWLGVDLADDTDWDEVAELLDASFRLTAPKRNVAELDAS